MAAHNTSKLSKDDKQFAMDYLFTFEKDIRLEYGHYDWNDKSLTSFCTENHIKPKVKRNAKNWNYYFWFDTKQDKDRVNDTAHHFLRHIRNAIAHGNIKKENKMMIVDDFHNQRQTMHGQIPCTTFWKFLSIVQNTKK